MDNTKEYICCASIHWDDGNVYPHQPKNILSGMCIAGWMHGNIIVIGSKIFGNMGERAKKGIIETQGFLTSKGRFVNREEAGKIALACGQIQKLSYFGGKELDSSDLY